ncbi:Recombinase [compost metagenome]
MGTAEEVAVPLLLPFERFMSSGDVDPERAPIIKRLFELYATGEYSLRDLRKVAKDAGLTNSLRSKQPLGSSALDRMLDNPFYTGTFRWNGKL